MNNLGFDVKKLDEQIEILKNSKPLSIIKVKFIWNKDKSKVIMKKS